MNFFSLYKRKFIFFFKKKINIDLEKNNKKLSLEDLFIKYGSDKASDWNGKNLGHGYTKFYYKHLNKLKNKKINILEIGSYAGASAAAFSKFFPKAKIYCLDINISNFKYYSKNINVYGLDATKTNSAKKFIKKISKKNRGIKFDIIIDDGSHILGDILKSFRFFFKFLNKNAYYVIEDFKHPNFLKHLNTPGEPKIDKLIQSIKKRKLIKSRILDINFQTMVFKNLKYIKSFKGNSKLSNIVFLKKI